MVRQVSFLGVFGSIEGLKNIDPKVSDTIKFRCRRKSKVLVCTLVYDHKTVDGFGELSTYNTVPASF